MAKIIRETHEKINRQTQNPGMKSPYRGMLGPDQNQGYSKTGKNSKGNGPRREPPAMHTEVKRRDALDQQFKFNF